MSYSVEKISGNQVKIAFTVPAEQFSDATQKAYLKLRGRINVPGFRKGKAPRKLIERMYGDNVFYEDALDILFPDVYQEALDAEKLQVVDRPEMDEVTQMELGKDLQFSVKVYVSPDVELGDYKGLKAVRYLHQVTDEEINRRIDRDVDKATTTVEVTDRALAQGDIAKLDYKGTVDGVAFEGGTAQDASLEIGSGSFIPGFEDQMVGMSIGEEKDLNVTFPEEYHAENLAGKDAVFHVALKGIEAKVKPELDDDFAKDVAGLDTFDAYKDSIRKELEDQAARSADNETENQLVQQAVDASDCDIPDAMVETRLDSMMRQYEMRLAYQGMRLKDFLQYTGQTEEQMREMYRSEAHNQVKTQLVLEAIAAKEALEPDEDRMKEAIAEDAKARGKDPEEYEKGLSEQERGYYRDDVKLRMAVDLIRENASVETKDEQDRVKASDAAKAVEAVAEAAEAMDQEEEDR